MGEKFYIINKFVNSLHDQTSKMADLSDHSAKRKWITSANRCFELSSWLGILNRIYSFYSNPSSSKDIPKLTIKYKGITLLTICYFEDLYL